MMHGEKNVKLRILCSVTLFFSENLVIYEVTRKSIVEQGQATDDNITWHMRIACLIPKATNTPSEYVIRIALPLQQNERYTYIACRVTD
jgi:hypothetical protein